MLMASRWLGNTNPEHRKEVWVQSSWLGVKSLEMIMNQEVECRMTRGPYHIIKGRPRR